MCTSTPAIAACYHRRCACRHRTGLPDYFGHHGRARKLCLVSLSHAAVPQGGTHDRRPNKRLQRCAMQSYISDSRGCWRQGEPVAYLQAAAGPVVQLLVHPIWWSVRHLEPRQRLEKLYLKATAGLTSAASARYDAALAFTLPSVRRSNYMAA